MIHAVLICLSSYVCPSYHGSSELPVNTSGLARLTKLYTPLHQPTQWVAKIFSMISSRPATLCNFLDAPELDHHMGPKAGKPDDPWKVVYRGYATLYFVFVVDSAESELGVLDLIQVNTFSSYYFGLTGLL